MSKQAETYIKALTIYKDFVKSQNNQLLTSLLNRGLKIQCNDYIESYYFSVILPTQKESDIGYITRMVEDFNLLTKVNVSLEYGEDFLKVRMPHANWL